MNNQEDGTEGGQGATENNFCSNFSRALETALKIKKTIYKSCETPSVLEEVSCYLVQMCFNFCTPYLGSDFFSGSQNDPCFHNKNSGCRLGKYVLMSCLILNLGCQCQTIAISLKNGALYHSQKQGIYQRAGKVNGKTSWISSSSPAVNTALWYTYQTYWVIGLVEYLGTAFGSIRSTGDQGISSCPYNVPSDAWEYGDNYNNWIIADANDVSIECLTGNHRCW